MRPQWAPCTAKTCTAPTSFGLRLRDHLSWTRAPHALHGSPIARSRCSRRTSLATSPPSASIRALWRSICAWARAATSVLARAGCGKRWTLGASTPTLPLLTPSCHGQLPVRVRDETVTKPPSCHGLLPVRAYLLQSALDALVSVGTFQTSTRSNETVTKPISPEATKPCGNPRASASDFLHSGPGPWAATAFRNRSLLVLGDSNLRL